MNAGQANAEEEEEGDAAEVLADERGNAGRLTSNK